MSTKATIDGKPILGTVPFTWEFRPGTSPVTAVCDLTPGDADALVSGGLKPLKLVIESDAGGQKKTSEISGVYALQKLPGPNEKIGRVLLADRRWFWNRKHIRGVYNQRRHIGTKRLTAHGSPPVVFPVTDDVAYAPWSLNNGVMWTAEDAIRDVMKRLVAHEAQNGASAGGFSIEGGNILQGVPFENLVLEDSGDQALARLLAYLPDVQVTVDASGEARVYPRIKSEVDILETMGAEKVGGGHIELVSLSRLRPREIHVLFTAECELRFDFEEEGIGGSDRGVGDELLCDNVLPIPDFVLPNVDGRTLVQGTWAYIDDVLPAWGSLPGFGPLTHQKIRQAMCPFMDLWSPMKFAGDQLVGAQAAHWGARISCLQTHWRRTYRINRRWMDRIQRLNAYTVATLDQETGTRGPALAWSDYCALNSQRSQLADVGNGANLVYMLNFRNYPKDGKIAKTDAAPCRVSVVDADQGIIRLDWLMDEIRLREMMIPGWVSNNPSPDFDAEVIAFNALTTFAGAGSIPQMASGYKAIVLLSAVPAVPNSADQLYRVVVKPSEVDATKDLGPFDGPVMELRIGPGLETARIAWNDDRKAAIKTLFGLEEGIPDVSDLVINDQPGRGGQAGSLNEIAKAAAGRVWASFADRNQGQARFGHVLAPLKGLMDRMALEVAPTGEVSTTLETGRVGPRVNMFSLMPSDVRAFVMRLAQAGK